ncbi:hypothetical protein SERLADRAFT_433024 [Serpula lacrymans var. lacrymans S7.9]|uniref:Uncharacterized protein n=1 Tax=Serpula lacrymans var. lacrymans (strain S7.9) TaxID=578457 RepID=F8NIX7_SERL9|nr:uncharacterized protein SERLADRAFT_433024 [Serpula lacrymans var. lacrymans S7.9]EGO29010.1 hypothetical protein SERLADRAFT_433024 [Serpula lacrymans var. lacrymans S7.9]
MQFVASGDTKICQNTETRKVLNGKAKFKKGNINYYSTWHCACVAQRRVFLNIRFVIDTCPCYQSTLVHDIEKLKINLPWWEDLHGWWREIPSINILAISSSPGHDHSKEASEIFSRSGRSRDISPNCQPLPAEAPTHQPSPAETPPSLPPPRTDPPPASTCTDPIVPALDQNVLQSMQHLHAALEAHPGYVRSPASTTLQQLLNQIPPPSVTDNFSLDTPSLEEDSEPHSVGSVSRTRGVSRARSPTFSPPQGRGTSPPFFSSAHSSQASLYAVSPALQEGGWRSFYQSSAGSDSDTTGFSSFPPGPSGSTSSAFTPPTQKTSSKRGCESVHAKALKEANSQLLVLLKGSNVIKRQKLDPRRLGMRLFITPPHG